MNIQQMAEIKAAEHFGGRVMGDCTRGVEVRGVALSPSFDLHGNYKGVRVLVNEWLGYSGPVRTPVRCGYIVLFQKMFAPEDWELVADRRWVERFVDAAEAVNGGCTYYARKTHHDPTPWLEGSPDSVSVRIGWDYNHAWDGGTPDHDRIVREAQTLVDALIARFPKMRVRNWLTGAYDVVPGEESKATAATAAQAHDAAEGRR
jgi:hypothetical protein